EPPFSLLRNETGKVGGYIGAIWNIMEKKLNFSTVFEEESVFGILVNGSWNGMIEKLRSRCVDIAISEFTMTRDRMEVVDFSLPPTII
ncbi:hypothetical protein L9F63_016466, partial [Diploptera punctata]